MKLTLFKASFLFMGGFWFSLPCVAGDVGFLAQPSSTAREDKIHGHDTGMLDRSTLTGDWGGRRPSMEKNGVTFEAVYTGEVVRNFDPGMVNNKKETIYLDNLDITLTIDTEKAGMWSGGTFFLYGLSNSGRNPSASVIGDLQTASNIEAPNTVSVYEIWYQQQFSDFLSLLVGFHDLNSTFYVSEYSSLFLNSTPGVGAEMSGNVAVSIFARTGLAARLHIDPTENWYIQMAVYDGDPATRTLKASEGKMYITETGWHSTTGTYKLGYWKHTANIVFNGKAFSNDYGYYGIVDQELLHLGGDSSIGAFIRWGAVPSDRNAITSHVDFGLHMHGLISNRSEDDIGVAYIRANTGAGNETVYEFTYRAVLTPWLAIQPSFQWIQNTGGLASNNSVKVGLLRFEVGF
ncbi:MAG: carbohydrate porin [Mariprofundaceae bacterium]|nr:carbohydrate porin [Mariprofundaceae bacterium]